MINQGEQGQRIYRKKGTLSDILPFGTSSLVLSFVCILVDSNITKKTFISC